MSRIGNQTVAIPGGVEVAVSGRTVNVKGPKGNLSIDLRLEVEVAVEDNEIVVSKNGSGSARDARAFHGMTRALINNMVSGVSQGFTINLEIQGVGWNAAATPKQLTLNIGFCHPVIFDIPEGIKCETPRPVEINISGADKQAVGQFAASVRAIRKPEPYKGKGIRYKGEFVRRKQGKSFGS
jgi:large subunit ribosomal protein L6